MKKFLVFILVAVLTFVGCMYIATRTDIFSGVASNFEMIMLNFSSGNIEEYSSDFVVNDLGKIKYNTYYYDKLDENQKKIYTAVANTVKKLDEAAVVKFEKEYNVYEVSEDIKVAMESFFADHPEVFYLNTEYQILTNSSVFGNMGKIYLGYSVASEEELNSQIEDIKLGIKEFTMDVDDSDTDYEKELKIHDSIAENVSYYSYNSIEEIPEIYHTTYSGIKESAAVCDGFTKLFQIALNEYNINSILVTGVLENDPHAWNMVEINGSWYNVDLTSDKTIKEYNNPVIHAYFNITNDYIKKSHKFSDESIIPEANSDEYNYYVKEGKIIDTSANFNTKFENILKSNDNDTLVEFKVGDGVTSVSEKIVRRLSQRDYLEYIDTSKNTIQYYNVLDTYIIMKK